MKKTYEIKNFTERLLEIWDHIIGRNCYYSQPVFCQCRVG